MYAMNADQEERRLDEKRWHFTTTTHLCKEVNNEKSLCMNPICKEVNNRKKECMTPNEVILDREQQSKILKHYIKNAEKGENFERRDRLKNEYDKLVFFQSENDEAAQKDDGFCVLCTTGELFILDNVEKNDKKSVILTLAQYVGASFFVIAIIAHVLGLRFSSVLPK